MAEVAVLGAGRMGGAMAQRLAAAGHGVRLWNRTPERADKVAAESEGEIRSCPAFTDAVAGAEMVLSMLADGEATCAVLLDSQFASSCIPGVIVVDLGTSGVAATRRLAEGLGAAGIAFVDAPVSGSVPAVQSGTLLVMASGEPEVIAAAAPVLSAFARKVIRVGDVGAGQVMKLAVNLVVHDLNAALAESLRVAENSGIERGDAYTVLQESVVGAPFVQYKRPAFVEPGTPVAMRLALVAKDLDLVLELARSEGVRIPVTERALEAVQEAVAAGYGERDMADLSRI